MTRYVVDASVGVEYLLRTPVGRELAPLLEEAALFAPELIDVEILAVLPHAALRGQIPLERATLAVGDLHAWPLVRLSHGELIADAWAHRENVTAYDSFYVAAAQRCRAALLTADGPLSRAPGLGVVVQNVLI